MRVSNALDRLAAVDVGAYPDIHRLEDDFDVVLLVLLIARENGVPSLTSSDVSYVSTHVFRRGLTRQRVASLLDGITDLVVAAPGPAPRRYVLLKRGEDQVRGRGSDVILIDPSRSFTAVQTLELLLGSVEGEVQLCDPYVSDKTLLALSAVPTTSHIRLLTCNVSEPQAFRRKFQAYGREYGNIDLRIAATADLHDRYLIDHTRMWVFGQSLNGIGKKQSFIVSVGPDIKGEISAAFEKRWRVASAWS